MRWWLKMLLNLVRGNDVTGRKVGPDDVWGDVSNAMKTYFTTIT